MNDIKKKIIYFSCFGLAVLILIAVEIAGYVNSQKLAENSNLTKHTYIVLTSAEKLLSKLTDAETGIRGYLLTDDISFLEPYNSAILEIPFEYKNLRNLTSDNLLQQKRLDTLKTFINVRLSVLSIMALLNHDENFPDASLKLPIIKGKPVQENIRRIISSINDDENRLLTLRLAKEEESTNYTNLSLILGSVTSITIMLILLSFLFKENRKKIKYEHELLETKNFLALTLNNIGEAVISTDKFSNILYMNAPAEEFTGFNFEEVRSKKFNYVVNIKDSITDIKIDNLVSRVLLEKNIPWENSKVVINREGRNIHIDNSASAIIDKNGNVLGTIMVLRDITGYKNSQDKIEESRALASSTLNSLSGHIALLDENGVITSVNKSWIIVSKLNKDFEKLSIGTNFIEACEKATGSNPIQAKKFADGIQKVLNGEIDEYFAAQPFYSQSGKRWYDGKATKYIGKGANKAVLTLEDITYKKEIEEQLKKSEEKFRSMVQNSSDTISLLNKEGSVIYVSQSSRNALGFDRQGRIGKNIFDYIHPDDLPKVKANFNMLLNTPGNVITQELKYKNSVGKFINVEITFNNLLSDTNVQAVVLNTRDITDRKSAEERLINALNEKEILLKEIHHRVKNNLQVVSSLLTLQSNHFEDVKLKSAFEESITRVRSMALVHQKLYQTDNSVSVNFREYLNNFISYLFHTYGGGRSRIKSIISSDDINMTIDDAIPCGLIINELVTNSFKYGFVNGGQGSITVSLTYEKQSEEYCLQIGDDGIGLPADMDLENNPSSFGFQLVTSLVQQMAGKIEIERNNGTLFKIRLKSSKYTKRL